MPSWVTLDRSNPLAPRAAFTGSSGAVGVIKS